jgi:hypothetical protein
MTDNQRVYSDEEFALILRTAAELASRAEQPRSSSEGLTLAEMKSAAQAGLDPALVERAARLLITRTTASPFERLLGGPLRYEHDARFPVRLDEDNATRLLSAVRISAAHFGSVNDGHSSSLGMTWSASAEGDVLSIVARPDADGTSVSVVIDRRGTFVLTSVVSSLAVLAAFIAGMTIHDASPLLGVGATVAGVSGTLAAARAFWTSSTRKARERIGAFVDAIGQTLDQLQNQAGDSRRAGDGKADPAGDAMAVRRVDAPKGDQGESLV